MELFRKELNFVVPEGEPVPEDQAFLPNAELMQDDEVLKLTRVFADLGFDKIRLTGGEPTVRTNVVELVRGIAGTPGIKNVSMTTNGVLLSRLAGPLAEAGLQRIADRNADGEDESVLLRPLRALLERGRCPADVLLAEVPDERPSRDAVIRVAAL